jgi:hypothetical protein
MSETEVCSPVSRRGGAVGSGQPLSPGARSNPGRTDAQRDRPLDASPPPRIMKTHSEPAPGEPPPAASTTIVGPED